MSAAAKPGRIKGLRKEQRISACKPVTVSGQDIFGNSFSQNTFTVEIAACGARLQGLPPVKIGASLWLEHGGNRAQYGVVWIGDENSKYRGHIGLKCNELDKSIFGLQIPTPGTFYDEYRRIEGELQRTEQRYRSLFENSLGLICTHDLDGNLMSLNPAAASALGYMPSDAVGKNLGEFLAPSVRHSLPDYLDRIRNVGTASGYMLVVARDREKRVWLYRNLLIREIGVPPYIVGHATDVTAQKKTEYELQTALKELKRALSEVKTLRGLLRVCAWCKRLRTEDGDWQDLESYIASHSDASFTHGICPECLPRFHNGSAEDGA